MLKISNVVVREILGEKVSWEQRLEGCEGVSHAGIWDKVAEELVQGMFVQHKGGRCDWRTRLTQSMAELQSEALIVQGFVSYYKTFGSSSESL